MPRAPPAPPEGDSAERLLLRSATRVILAATTSSSSGGQLHSPSLEADLRIVRELLQEPDAKSQLAALWSRTPGSALTLVKLLAVVLHRAEETATTGDHTQHAQLVSVALHLIEGATYHDITSHTLLRARLRALQRPALAIVRSQALQCFARLLAAEGPRSFASIAAARRAALAAARCHRGCGSRASAAGLPQGAAAAISTAAVRSAATACELLRGCCHLHLGLAFVAMSTWAFGSRRAAANSDNGHRLLLLQELTAVLQQSQVLDHAAKLLYDTGRMLTTHGVNSNPRSELLAAAQMWLHAWLHHLLDCYESRQQLHDAGLPGPCLLQLLTAQAVEAVCWWEEAGGGREGGGGSNSSSGGASGSNHSVSSKGCNQGEGASGSRNDGGESRGSSGGMRYGLSTEAAAIIRDLLGLPQGRQAACSASSASAAAAALHCWTLALTPGCGLPVVLTTPVAAAAVPPAGFGSAAVYQLCLRVCDACTGLLAAGGRGEAHEEASCSAAALAVVSAHDALAQRRRAHSSGAHTVHGAAVEPQQEQLQQQEQRVWARPPRWWEAGVAVLAAASSVVVDDEGSMMWGDVALLLRYQLGEGQLALPLPGYLPPAPLPDVAAALSAGYLPALERLLRRKCRYLIDGACTAGTNAACLGLTWSRLGWLLAYAEPRQAASLLATVGKVWQTSFLTQSAGEEGGNEPETLQARKAEALMESMRVMTDGMAWARERKQTAQQTGEGDCDAPGRQLLQLLAFALSQWLPVWSMRAEHCLRFDQREWGRQRQLRPGNGPQPSSAVSPITLGRTSTTAVAHGILSLIGSALGRHTNRIGISFAGGGGSSSSGGGSDSSCGDGGSGGGSSSSPAPLAEKEEGWNEAGARSGSRGAAGSSSSSSVMHTSIQERDPDQEQAAWRQLLFEEANVVDVVSRIFNCVFTGILDPCDAAPLWPVLGKLLRHHTPAVRARLLALLAGGGDGVGGGADGTGSQDPGLLKNLIALLVGDGSGFRCDGMGGSNGLLTDGRLAACLRAVAGSEGLEREGETDAAAAAAAAEDENEEEESPMFAPLASARSLLRTCAWAGCERDVGDTAAEAEAALSACGCGCGRVWFCGQECEAAFRRCTAGH